MHVQTTYRLRQKVRAYRHLYRSMRLKAARLQQERDALVSHIAALRRDGANAICEILSATAPSFPPLNTDGDEEYSQSPLQAKDASVCSWLKRWPPGALVAWRRETQPESPNVRQHQPTCQLLHASPCCTPVGARRHGNFPVEQECVVTTIGGDCHTASMSGKQLLVERSEESHPKSSFLQNCLEKETDFTLQAQNDSTRDTRPLPQSMSHMALQSSSAPTLLSTSKTKAALIPGCAKVGSAFASYQALASESCPVHGAGLQWKASLVHDLKPRRFSLDTGTLEQTSCFAGITESNNFVPFLGMTNPGCDKLLKN